MEENKTKCCVCIEQKGKKHSEITAGEHEEKARVIAGQQQKYQQKRKW